MRNVRIAIAKICYISIPWVYVLCCVLLVWTSWYICPVLCRAEFVKGKKSSWASGPPPPHSLSNHARPKTVLPHPSPSSSSLLPSELLCFSIVAFFCRARPLKQIGEVTQNKEYTEPCLEWEVGNGHLMSQILKEESKIFPSSRVAEVVRRHKGPSPKSLDLDENFKH